jgi:diaminopimelate decarboxylase
MTTTKPVHAPRDEFPVVDGCLQVGGVPLTRLAQRVGQTPFYAYDRYALDRRVEKVRAILPAGMRLHYSMKANPMPALVQHMAALVDGIDVASGGELKTALDAGMDAHRISFAGPGKSVRELRQSVAAGVTVNVESPRELAALAQAGHEAGVAPRVVLRVNPDFELKSSGMKMGGGAKQFGIDAETVPAVLRQARELGLQVLGFHIFAGSQSLKADAIIEAQAKSFELALALAAHVHDPLQQVNIGGAFGIPYFPGDQALDLAPIGAHLGAWSGRLAKELPGAHAAIELGRYLVGEAGIYVTRVVDRKESRGQVFLVCDGGLHHHLAASGNFGQVIRKNYPVAVGNRMDAQGGPASLVGPLCTPLDVLADRMDLGHAQEGDLLVVFQSGAYGLTASPNAFLGHPAPVEVLV